MVTASHLGALSYLLGDQVQGALTAPWQVTEDRWQMNLEYRIRNTAPLRCDLCVLLWVFFGAASVITL